MVDRETPPEKSSKDESEGWVENLAKRSSGLPSEEAKPAAKSDPEEKSLWAYAGLGIQFAATVSLFAYGGYKLDQYMGWKGLALITLSLIAVVGNLYLLIKDALKENRTPKK